MSSGASFLDSGFTLAGGIQRGTEETAPLTDQEMLMVKRLFSDPFSIPQEFKAWLVAYLETNPPATNVSSVTGLESLMKATLATSPTLPPTGAIMQYWGATDPPDRPRWLIMDNRLMDRTTYSALFGVIGFTGSYPTPGVDPGSNKFYLPEGRGAVLAGKGTHGDVTSIGRNDGNAVANRTPKHQTSNALTLPDHAHTVGNHDHGGGYHGHYIDVFFHSYVNSVSVAAGEDVSPSYANTNDFGSTPNNADVGYAKPVWTISAQAPGTTGPTSFPAIGGSMGPGPGRPTDAPAFTVVNHIIFVGT